MRGKKRFIQLGVIGVLLLTILTSTALAATSKNQDNKKEKLAVWKIEKEDIHKSNSIKFPQKNRDFKPKGKSNLPFEKDSNANDVKKARPEKSDAIK